MSARIFFAVGLIAVVILSTALTHIVSKPSAPATAPEGARHASIKPDAKRHKETSVGAVSGRREAAPRARAAAPAHAATAAYTLRDLAVTAVLSAFMTWLAGVLLRSKERRIVQTRLNEAAQALAAAENAERARIARELHDGVSQLLLATRHSFETAFERGVLGSTDYMKHYTRGMERLDDTMREIRRVSHNMKPAVLQDLPFVDALQHLGREFAERTRIRTSVTAADASVSEKLSPPAKTALYRIAQEALTNVERHSAASHVELKLEEQSEHLTLAITDNGQGFDPGRGGTVSRMGIGLSNMRERLTEIGGTLLLRSAGEGTEVIARIPLPAMQQTRNHSASRAA